MPPARALTLRGQHLLLMFLALLGLAATVLWWVLGPHVFLDAIVSGFGACL